MPSGDFSNAVWGGNRKSWDINEPIRILALPWLRSLYSKTRTKNSRVLFFLRVHTVFDFLVRLMSKPVLSSSRVTTCYQRNLRPCTTFRTKPNAITDECLMPRVGNYSRLGRKALCPDVLLLERSFFLVFAAR